MRKLGLTLHLLFWLACIAPAFADNTVGPTNQIICNNFAQTTAIVSATTTNLVTGVAGKAIFICGWHVTTTVTAPGPGFQFEYGTQGGPCTTPTALTPTFTVSNTAPSADHISIATLSAPQGAQICVVTTGTVTNIAIELYYSQF